MDSLPHNPAFRRASQLGEGRAWQEQAWRRSDLEAEEAKSKLEAGDPAMGRGKMG